MKSVLQWSIATALFAASGCNILYLAGVWPRTTVSVGTLLVIVCYLAVVIYKRKGDNQTVSDTRMDCLRGNATGVLAVIWMITMGLTMFWRA